MIDLNKFLKNLSKKEKEELLKLLNTEAMDSSSDKVIYCPKCGSFHLVKNGKAKGHQRFICQDCNQHFTEYRNTIFNLTKKNIQLWKSYIKMMFNGYTIKQIANELHICMQTSFRWRHKILSVLENKFMNNTSSGIVEVDETLILFSHKGQKIDGAKERKIGGKAKKRGQSDEQKGILVAIDRKKNVISEIYGEGKISTQEIRDILNGRIKKKSVLVADGCNAYDRFADENNFELAKISEEKKKGIYHINNAN